VRQFAGISERQFCSRFPLKVTVSETLQRFWSLRHAEQQTL